MCSRIVNGVKLLNSGSKGETLASLGTAHRLLPVRSRVREYSECETCHISLLSRLGLERGSFAREICGLNAPGLQSTFLFIINSGAYHL